MSSPEFLVTVVVPTHNRSQYAVPCIKSILEISSPLLQVVVHDTSNDECKLKEWALKQSDQRLTYVHFPERLSMTENHEHAVALSKGEFVCLIGDDDSVSEKIIDAAIYAKERKFFFLSPKVKASYYWPDFRSRVFGAAHAGRLYLGSFSREENELDVFQSLTMALGQSCQGTDGLPKLYHGLVHRGLLDDVRKKYGRVFFGTSPDMSAAIILSLAGGRHHVIDYPFTLPGGAGGSNSGRSASGKHKGDLANDPHIKPFKNLNWPAVLPRFFSVETVWAHAGWETLVGTGNEEWLKKFNLAKLYAICIMRHPEYRSYTLDSWKEARKQNYVKTGVASVVKEMVGFFFKLILATTKRLMHPDAGNGRIVIAVVDDVCLARRELDQYLSRGGAFLRDESSQG